MNQVTAVVSGEQAVITSRQILDQQWNTKEEYLEWRKAWKLAYMNLSQGIRSLRQARSLAGKEKRAITDLEKQAAVTAVHQLSTFGERAVNLGHGSDVILHHAKKEAFDLMCRLSMNKQKAAHAAQERFTEIDREKIARLGEKYSQIGELLLNLCSSIDRASMEPLFELDYDNLTAEEFAANLNGCMQFAFTKQRRLAKERSDREFIDRLNKRQREAKARAERQQQQRVK